MKELTYLIYIVLWEGMIFGGTGYAVFILNRSGWWFALAILIGGMAYSPLKWIHGQDTLHYRNRHRNLGEHDEPD